MRNEDGLNLRSNLSVRKKTNFDKVTFRTKFMNSINALKFLKTKCHKGLDSFHMQFYIKFKKLITLFFTLGIVFFLYYFFMNWHLIPYYDSIEGSYNFELYIPLHTKPQNLITSQMKEKNLKNLKNVNNNIKDNDSFNIFNDDGVPPLAVANNLMEINYGLIQFLFLNFFFLMMIISLILTILKNPGELGNKYNNIYSIPRFIKTLMKFFLTFDDENQNEMDLLENDGEEESLFEDLKFILSNETNLLEKISDYSKNNMSTIGVNQEDLSKKYLTLEMDNFTKFKEFERFSQPVCEDIIKMFENEFNKLIKDDQELKEMNNIPFNELTEYKRFCHFCLIKKPDRSHHCRKCGVCIRKLDHHCFYLYSCIGHGNYKYFMLVLFYSLNILVFMFFTLFQSLRFYLNEFGVSTYFIFFAIVYLFVFFLMSLIGYFFYVHINLLIYNQTTIDSVEKRSYTKNENNIYDRGVYENIISVMGPLWLWLIPYAPENKYDGYSFKINNQTKMKCAENRRSSALEKMRI